MKHLLSRSITSLSLLTLLCVAGCADLNDPYSSPSRPYNGGYDSGYDRYDNRREHRAVERERDRLEDERRELDRERERERDRRRQEEQHRYTPPPAPRQEHCPSGFSPSENKCSGEERKRGCRDMRLPGGLGCVSR